MKNMDSFWKLAEQTFLFDNKKTIWGGYAISSICMANALWQMALILWGHRELSMKAIECILLSSAIGIIGFVFCYFRKSASIRVKFYTACLVLTAFCAYLCILHPDATTRRYPNSELNHAIFLAGIVFFGGGCLWVMYNDCKWNLKKKKKNNKHKRISENSN